MQRVVVSLIRQGSCLSNIAFNLKQRDDLPADVRKSCDETQRAWDQVLSNVPKWIRNLSDTP